VGGVGVYFGVTKNDRGMGRWGRRVRLGQKCHRLGRGNKRKTVVVTRTKGALMRRGRIISILYQRAGTNGRT